MAGNAKDAPTANGVKELQEHAESTRLCLSTTSALVVSVGASLAISIGSPALVYYEGQDSPLEKPMTEEEGGTFAAIFSVASTTGYLLSWPSTRYCGRKYRGVMGMLESLTLNIAWATGIFLYGFSGLTFPQLILVLAACLVPTLIFVILVGEESPQWLIKVGHVEKARKTLQRLRGETYPGLEEELEELIQCCSKKTEKQQDFARSVKPFVLLLSLLIFQVSSGLDLMSHYSLQIFYELLGGNVQAGNAVATIFQIGFALGYLCSTPIMNRFPRRRQVITSAILVGIFVTLLVILFRTQQELDERSVSLDYLTMGVIPTSSFVFGLGLGPVCYTLLGELLPACHKAAGTAVILSIRSLVSASIKKVFPFARGALGLDAVLFASALMAFFGATVMYCFLPETKGKSLTELDMLFGKRENNNANSESLKSPLLGRKK